MKAEDLMIGDWVCVRSNDGEDTHNFKISTISEIGVNSGSGFVGFDEDLEPIPLTPEILEKNGFEHEDSTGYVYDDYGTSNKVIVDMWDGTIKILHNYDIAFSRTYWRTVNVHELQHILKDLELEKEIAL